MVPGGALPCAPSAACWPLRHRAAYAMSCCAVVKSIDYGTFSLVLPACQACLLHAQVPKPLLPYLERNSCCQHM